ncbi:MAG: hypothetical protein CL811_10260 [Colwelliaceae bacterium]|nr:hypothetical protein [Colwelliaceae bacterium]|tara:strand:- start:938 stop:1708 length:771 start_codon:yes stop_codon:yes gene_type:complete
MSFFDKKEEVIDFILTEKGREKYSKGFLSPKYYVFGDRDIIYDNSSSAQQNTIIGRIKDDLRIKNLSSYADVKTKKREYPSALELGETEILTQSAPSWKVEFIEGNMDSGSFIQYPTEIKNTASFEARVNDERIPQLNVEVVYDLYTEKKDGTNTIFFEKSSEDILIKISEKNVLYDETNQELFFEVFKVGYKKFFDEPTASLSQLTLEESDFEKTSVQHYIDILVDNLALLDHKKKIKNIYGDQIIEDKNICEDK